MMTKKAFASSTDLAPKKETLEVLADGVYSFTAEGDPNVGAIEAEDFLIAFEARATLGGCPRIGCPAAVAINWSKNSCFFVK